MVELLFHGATEEVTGSMHMLRVGDRWLALECGLYQGRRESSERKNREWPVPPRDVDAVILSHAHTDHAGRLPYLVNQGFEGPIYCTPATRDLCAIMLPDSAHIQQEDVYYVNKRRARKGLDPIEALYDLHDALAAVHNMRTVSTNRWFAPIPGVQVRFNEAGHMLGSAGVHVVFGDRPDASPSLYFTGDVGRFEAAILHDPAPLPPADYVISESTYGGRVNEDPEVSHDRVLEVISRTLARGGKVIMPSFAVGRTQTIIYYLQQHFAEGRLQRVPVYIDSPLAYDATQVFRMHADLFDAEARDMLRGTSGVLGAGCCTFIRDVEDSKALHQKQDPCVIISASGMCEAGRIRHHLKNNISNPKHTILIPGYQAEGTLGRRLVEGAKRITLFHEEYQVRADVVQINGFSGHADQRELIELLSPLRSRARSVFLVHGERSQSDVLAERLRTTGFADVQVAVRGQRVRLSG
ncbi:MAG: MBL fold metallo-hydrolase [Planctomycetia bacterium]|nr:MAG: MBL fold metallo-hydrolase [Planctomycetia bacterium]